MLAEMVRAKEVELTASCAPEVKPGGAIGRFQLVRELGRGGFGVVYEAFDGELSRTVALKVVKPGIRIAPRGSQWLMREAEAVARLNHPNIITLHDFGQGPGGPFLVFELLRGQSLADRLRQGRFDADQAIDVGLAVSRALVHAHTAGVVHRDLTASNVHLGEDGVVKVLDFGLAHLFGRDGVSDGGTPAYMAPEQWEGESGDARTDLFALGVILFQALSGTYPYEIDKGWSEALEPGQTPRLPASVAPRRLRRLVESLIDRSPEQRPENARAVRDQLLAMRRAREGAGRQRMLWGLGAVTAAAVALAAWLFVRPEPPPGEQVKVVLAAMENGAGEATLDAVPGLLAAALEPSPRVKLVPPSRLAYASRQAGLGDPGRIDAEKGRSLARLAGAAVVLVPGAWQEDGHPVLSVSAVESESGRTLFTARAAVGEHAALSSAVDRLSDRIRRELNERAADRKLRRPVAEIVTASPEAARWYYQGVDCLSTRRSAQGTALQCAPAFERALALDPTFPLAHYQLATANFLPGDSGERARPHIERALGAADRLPSREATLLRALSSRVDGRLEEALREYDELLAAAPEDPEVLGLASGVEIERGNWAAAAQYLEKLVVVAPEQEHPLLVLIEALGRLNRADDLRDLVEKLEATQPARWRAIVEARLWLGQQDAALAAARRGVAAAGAAELGTLVYALLAGGEFAEAEGVARGQARRARSSPADSAAVDAALTGQGRIVEALRWVDAGEPTRPQSEASNTAFRQALIAAGSGDPGRVWPHAARAFALDPALAADLAVVLMLLGDAEHAELLARGLPPGSFADQEVQALRQWKRGDAVSALASLARLESQDSWPIYGLAPAYLIAEISASSGDDPGTVAAVARFRRLPADRIWRAWAYPRCLYLAASAHLRLGERVTGRDELHSLDVMLKRADPGNALAVQARALRSRM